MHAQTIDFICVSGDGCELGVNYKSVFVPQSCKKRLSLKRSEIGIINDQLGWKFEVPVKTRNMSGHITSKSYLLKTS